MFKNKLKMEKWRRTLNSGAFRRRVNQYKNCATSETAENYDGEIVAENYEIVDDQKMEPDEDYLETAEDDLEIEPEEYDQNMEHAESEGDEQETCEEDVYSPDEDDDDEETWTNLEFEVMMDAAGNPVTNDDVDEQENLSEFLRKWSVSFNISQQAMRPLLQRLHRLDHTVPESPRRLLRTLRTKPTIADIGGGQYWHQGLEKNLRLIFPDLEEDTTIHININIDGLPLFKNGTSQVWPILFNIHEMSDVKPMIIGMFYGKSKPKKVEEFLDPFVSEMLPTLESGIEINGKTLSVKLRAMICDSPARAFIKGTVNFNSLNGCLKCCTLGQHSKLLRTNIFPQTIAEKRTDEGFRNYQYDGHYQVYQARENGKIMKTRVVSPLLRLPIDMVEDIIVADSLHILHLGITKKLLSTYKDGHTGFDGKWSKNDISLISNAMTSIRLPLEIHRAVRDLECLTHWKASECASFLHYIGIVLLKHFLKPEHYINFANLFCAVTICSSDYYKRFLPVAHNLFIEFISNYYQLFKSVTSNVHNLAHVVEEVKRFGSLPSISSYPFENHLSQIKKLVRSGKLPLHQIINRVTERSFLKTTENESIQYPQLKYNVKNDSTAFTCIILAKNFTLNTTFPNKWFLTKQGKIVAMDFAKMNEIFGSELISPYGNLFDDPLLSSFINVFTVADELTFTKSKKYDLSQILCKLVVIQIFNETSFIPLLHTLPSNEVL